MSSLIGMTGRYNMLQSLLFSNELEALGKYYHSFDLLGLHVVQRDEPQYLMNQKCKEGTILSFLWLAMEKSKKTYTDQPSVLETFCADGYYATYAKRLGAGRVNGIDWDIDSINQANSVYRVLFGEFDRFLKEDVYTFTPSEPYDVVLCCGGLYHVSDPRHVVETCFTKFSKKFLVIQSVVSMEYDDEEYFVTPAPDWGHGCRFSFGFLKRMVVEVGWQIVASHFNELEGNNRLCDRGSAYFLCQK